MTTALDPNAGPWTDEDHTRMHAFDEPLALAIKKTLNVPRYGWWGRDAIDWGGGRGLYLEALAVSGARTLLVEPEATPSNPAVDLLRWDLTRPCRWIQPAAVVLCLEVMEHIPEEHHRVAFDNICRSVAPGGFLIFSGATPGQGGHGHVAERPKAEWQQEIKGRGLLMVADMTSKLRQAATLPWFKRNLMVFVRPAARGRP